MDIGIPRIYRGIGFGFLQFSIWELMASVLIIGVLAVAALPIFVRYIDIVKVSHIFGGSPFIEMKMDMMCFHAHHGHWPADNRQTADFGGAVSYESKDVEFIQKAEIENGAVHFTLAGKFAGKVITVRPAISQQDDFGPVIWVCDTPRHLNGWKIFGKDRTDVDPKYIHSKLR